MPVIVAIEGGGTKFVCAASLDGTSLLERKVVPTRSPQETLPDLLEYVDRAALTYGRISAISLAVFGPIETDPNRSAYGRVGSTSKQGWTGFDYLEAFEKYNCLVFVNSDVTAAAAGELSACTDTEIKRLAYVTVGTGIGVGIADRETYLRLPLRNLEMGHLTAERSRDDPWTASVCPFHTCCFEGLASGPAIEKRWGASLSDLVDPNGAVALEAHYLGQLASAIALAQAPDRIVFGGGVMGTEGLFPRIGPEMRSALGNYGSLHSNRSSFMLMAEPICGGNSALIGAFALASSGLQTY